ncbi:hypothetical protein HN51_016227 [Arachis hypogaea]|nr:TPR repeat protein [Arachis hypogaea]
MPSPITISPAHTATQVCRRTVSSVAQQAPSRSELRRAITSFDQSPLVSASLSVSHSPYRPAACSVEALKPEGAFEIERKPSSSSLEGAFELPRVPDPWQRGLSLYYLDRFEEGAEQFRLDVAQNPNNTEESIWCFLCEAQLYGVDEARKPYLEVSH